MLAMGFHPPGPAYFLVESFSYQPNTNTLRAYYHNARQGKVQEKEEEEEEERKLCTVKRKATLVICAWASDAGMAKRRGG